MNKTFGTVGVIVALAAVLTTGCGKKESSKADAAPAPKGKSDPLSGYVGGVLKGGEQAKGMIGISALQAAVRLYQAQENKNPASLEDLVTQGYVPQMPPAPVGKKYAYDAKTGKVELADK